MLCAVLFVVPGPLALLLVLTPGEIVHSRFYYPGQNFPPRLLLCYSRSASPLPSPSGSFCAAADEPPQALHTFHAGQYS